MNIVPAQFKFERKGMLPILIVTGIVKTSTPDIENLLLMRAIQIIERAENLKGRPMEIDSKEEARDVKKGITMVKFRIIFKNEEDYSKAFEALRKELG